MSIMKKVVVANDKDLSFLCDHTAISLLKAHKNVILFHVSSGSNQNILKTFSFIKNRSLVSSSASIHLDNDDFNENNIKNNDFVLIDLPENVLLSNRVIIKKIGESNNNSIVLIHLDNESQKTAKIIEDTVSCIGCTCIVFTQNKHKTFELFELFSPGDSQRLHFHPISSE